MSANNRLGMIENHVGGFFEWAIEPNCKCGMLKSAVEEGFMFVGNFVDAERGNNFYFMPLLADGTLARDDGVSMLYCPWCGDEIRGSKHYPKRSSGTG